MMTTEPRPPDGRPGPDRGGTLLTALATVVVSVAGWGLAIAVNLVAIAVAIALARRATPETVAFTVVALIALLAVSIALSIWVALHFGRRARRMAPRV
jgi:hypothetical protein